MGWRMSTRHEHSTSSPGVKSLGHDRTTHSKVKTPVGPTYGGALASGAQPHRVAEMRN